MLKRLGQIELAICFVLLAGITGLVFVAAIMRFFGHPLTWSVDMAQLLFIWLCMLGATRAMREKSHLGMEILAKRLGYVRQFWVEMVCSAIILAFLAALVVEGVKLTLLNSERTFGDSTLSYSWVTARRAGRLRSSRHRADLQHGPRLARTRPGPPRLYTHSRRRRRAGPRRSLRCC